jgi:hypothetical protein
MELKIKDAEKNTKNMQISPIEDYWTKNAPIVWHRLWERLFVLTKLKIRNGDDHTFIMASDFPSVKIFAPRKIHVRL